jgi:TatD DNase family protein
MLIDSHAHLTHASLIEEAPSLLKRGQESGIEAIVNIATRPTELEAGLALSKDYPFVYHAAATTPHDVEQEGEEAFPYMEEMARKGSLVAVGETGLDYHYFPSTRTMQQDFLRRYLRLAQECHLPVIIHCREAFDDLFNIIDACYQGGPGVLHCFTGTLREAQQVIERGWYLSLSGIVTFKKSHELQQVAREVPLGRLLIETDAPYLAPTPYRGKQNEPAFLLATARFIANLRSIPLEELAAATSQNARSLFKI